MTNHGKVVGKRILLVDDEQSVRKSLRLLLSLDEHIVYEAADGLAACRLFTPGDFDLVISDFSMPGMNGDELARTIKCLVPSQPILMITAFAGQLQDLNTPVDAVLEKPFTLGDLRKTISFVLTPKVPKQAVPTSELFPERKSR